ncbi:hypothetical protein Tco_0870591 [Tanacetum coccineum]
MERFVMELDVNIMAWNYLNNVMLLNLIKNLYVPFSIPFDPKRYYKDDVYTRILRRPKYVFFTLFELRKLVSKNGYDVLDFEMKLGKIYRKEVHKVQVFNFGGLTDLMAEELSGRMLMEHRFGEAVLDLDTVGALQFQLGGVRRRMSWREFILGMGLHAVEEIESFRFGAYWAESARQGGSECLLERDFICWRFPWHNPGVDVGSVNIPYLLARYLRLFASGRKQGAMISGGQFVARLAKHFGLLTKERLEGLTVIVRDLLEIDMDELPVATAGAFEIAEGASDVVEGDQAISTPVQVPQPPPAARTISQRLARLEEDVHGIQVSLREQREVVDAMARDFSKFTVWVAKGISQLLDSVRATYV